MREDNRGTSAYYPNGIIQAGGKATRLGPLAAQISKALVSIGNRPQVVNQIMQLQEAGCRKVLVVASVSTYQQTADMIRRAGLDRVATVIADHHERGPVMGISFAMQHASIDHNVGTYVLFADTTFSEALPTVRSNWVGVSTTYDQSRSWCYSTDSGKRYVDGVPTESNTPVTIGAYYFEDSCAMHYAATQALRYEVSPGMSALFNNFVHEINQHEFSTWSDVGDLFSLAKTRQTRFISRARHTLELRDDGTVTKHGASLAEAQFMTEIDKLPISGQTLFPRVFDVSANPYTSYTMEYVDLPTLAELWLYWPGSGDTWAKIVRSIVSRLQRDLWVESDVMTEQEVVGYFGTKAYTRLLEWKPEVVDEKLLSKIAEACSIIGTDTWIVGHGDLNFTNILYSLNTGGFKLVDPRGGLVPQIYEYAKLAYSPVFSAISHDLFDGHGPLPDRTEEARAVEAELMKDVDWRRVRAVVALTLLAACPLHSDRQAKMLYYRGMGMLDDLTA